MSNTKTNMWLVIVLKLWKWDDNNIDYQINYCTVNCFALPQICNHIFWLADSNHIYYAGTVCAHTGGTITLATDV